MNKRELVLNLLDSDKKQTYIPAGFFIHFDPSYHVLRTAAAQGSEGRHREALP